MAASDLLTLLRARLDAMEPKQRERVIKGGVLGLGAIFLISMYYVSGQDAKKPAPAKESLSLIELGDARLEDDIRAQVEKERLDGQARNEEQDKQLKTQEEKIQLQEAQLLAMQQAMQSLSASPALGLPEVPLEGEAPNDPLAWELAAGGGASRGAASPSNNPGQPPPPPPPVEYVGGLGHAKPEGASAAAAEAQKKSRKFYLPTSFMPAKLLTGLKAKTVESARGDPEPMLLRVQAPAILPNEVRAQLEGCLVVAHGYGSLASERVEARLVSISCLDFEGKSLIDAELRGIVVDKDGVKGLAGHPVSKMGANMARLMVAGVVQGAGEAFEASAATTSVSPLGQTQTIDPGQIGRAGAGRGVAKASEELSRIYSELVRQSAPVIEVGPAKEVTVVVTEGVWLELKNYEEGS